MLKTRLGLFFFMVIWLFMFSLLGAYGAQPENLLTNGGFEDGIFDPWSVYGTVGTREVVKELKKAKVPEDPIEGEFCAHIIVTTKGANFWDSGLQHKGHVFEKGKKYTLSVFLKTNKAIQINFKPELDKDPWPGYGERQFTITEEWQEFSTTTPVMAADVNPACITFHIAFDACEFWVDGARFYEGDYVEPDFGSKPKAVRPEAKLATAWGKIKVN